MWRNQKQHKVLSNLCDKYYYWRMKQTFQMFLVFYNTSKYKISIEYIISLSALPSLSSFISLQLSDSLFGGRAWI